MRMYYMYHANENWDETEYMYMYAHYRLYFRSAQTPAAITSIDPSWRNGLCTQQ